MIVLWFVIMSATPGAPSLEMYEDLCRAKDKGVPRLEAGFIRSAGGRVHQTITLYCMAPKEPEEKKKIRT